MKKRITGLLLGMMVIMMLFTSCGKNDNSSSKVYNVYLACDSPEDTVTYILLDKFASLMEEKSNGRIVGKRFSNAKLGGDVEITEALQHGNITFVVQNTAPQVNFVPELGVFDLPMAFPNIEVARKVLDGPLLDKLKEAHARQNIKLFGYADQGFREMSSNKKIDKMADLKGVKIRTMSNPNHIEFWKAVGANPTPMNFGELYIGLQQGVVVAQENPIEATVAAKLHEQQDYIVMTNHVIHGLSLIGSPKILENLPDDLQKVVDEAAVEAIAYARQKADERVDGRLKIVTDSGTEILDFNQQLYDEMKAAGQPIYTSIANKIGKDLVDLLTSEVEKATNELANN